MQSISLKFAPYRPIPINLKAQLFKEECHASFIKMFFSDCDNVHLDLDLVL